MKRVVATALAILTIGCSKSTSWSGRITSKQERPGLSFLNPHADAVKVLIIDGKRFERVRGLPPFYLKVPGMEAVLFVVDEKDRRVTYHIVDMQNGQDIAVQASSSVFGHAIGASSSNRCDTIEEASPGKIVLCDRGVDSEGTRKTLTYINPQNKTITGEKTLFLDASGKLLRTHEEQPPF
jgi:hypothetical protein